MWPWRSRRYIAFARKFQPVLTADAADYLVNAYRQLRQRDGGSTMSASRITVRQLESLIRLAEANARLACLSQVAIHLENKKKNQPTKLGIVSRHPSLPLLFIR